jgi:hypothetical protein
MPIKKLDSESATWAAVVCKLRAMAGKPGKYISIENGPKAVSAPKMRIREK